MCLFLKKRILSGIFPNVNNENQYDEHLKEAIQEACLAMNLINTEYFEMKICQLYDALRIQPGVMIIGDPLTGKSSIRKVLEQALSILMQKNQLNEREVKSIIINPKSMTIEQLYGEFEAASHEWQDGILSLNYKQFAVSKENTRKWLVFDGPTEINWMENLKNILDNNRKLCLMSGDIIFLNESMNIIFESLDLKWASPSIVSLSIQLKLIMISKIIHFLLFKF